MHESMGYAKKAEKTEKVVMIRVANKQRKQDPKSRIKSKTLFSM